MLGWLQHEGLHTRHVDRRCRRGFDGHIGRRLRGSPTLRGAYCWRTSQRVRARSFSTPLLPRVARHGEKVVCGEVLATLPQYPKRLIGSHPPLLHYSKRPPSKPKKAKRGGARRDSKDYDDDDEANESSELSQVVRLEEQPKCIKGGKMRPYQVIIARSIRSIEPAAPSTLSLRQRPFPARSPPAALTLRMAHVEC